MHFPRARTAALLAVALSLALGACAQIEDGAGRDGSDSSERQARSTPGIEGVDGLETAQQQAGYAIGLELGSTLLPVQDEIDLDAMFEGVRDVLAEREPKVDEAQFMQIMTDLGERMRVDQEAHAAEQEERAREAAAEGEAFLEQNAQRPEVQVTGSGLQYEVLEAGEGASPQPGDRVRVHYEGRLLDGEVFDSSVARGEPAEFTLEDVVPGWQEGLQLMATGGRYRLWIPAALGYGEEGAPFGPIGPNATLEFEIELLEVVPAASLE